MVTSRGTYRVEGLRQLGANLAQLGTAVQKRIARSTTNAGAQVVKGAVVEKAAQQPTLADAPFEIEGVVYQPGEIARNVQVVRIKDPDMTSEHIVRIRSNKKNGYIGRIASFNEFGTVKMAAQPFMTPAFAQSRDRALQAMVKTLNAGITREARKLKKGKV